MALNPISFTEQVVSDFLRYQLTTYPLADSDLHAQMRAILGDAEFEARCDSKVHASSPPTATMPTPTPTPKPAPGQLKLID